ncbi:protein of unknown function DUF23 domain-containing protein [Aphelenchoides besseyi]|nr:protein of unknown function DUF23 domain-containing protein [Aphelenchoides besseyi]
MLIKICPIQMDELKKLASSPAITRRPNFSLKSLVLLLCNYILLIGTVLFILALYFLISQGLMKENGDANRAAFHDLTYIRSAYRVSDTTIRLVVVRSVQNHKNLTYEFGLKKGKIRLECQNLQCPDEFSPPCEITGFVGIIDDITKNNRQSYIVIFSDGNETPLDVRRKTAPPYELGVMIQPVYLHTDFTLFVQFFEYWLSENATKFYIYRESYTQEVGELLEFYGKQKGVFMAIFDCTHRARTEVKYLVQTDLDEMLYVGQKRSVIEFMRAMDLQEPEMAAVSFRSRRVISKPLLDSIKNSSWVDVKHPRDISFTNLENVILEKKVFKRPLYAKMVYKPERVFRVHIHRQLPTEPIIGTDRPYKHVNIAPEGGVVLHIRRLKDMYKWTNSVNSSIIRPKAQVMQMASVQRFKNFKSNLTEWRNYGLKVNEKIENCRQAMNRNRQNACHNLRSVVKSETTRISNRVYLGPNDAFKNVNLRFYIRSAFRVSDKEIRLTIVKDYRNKRKLRYEFNKQTGDVRLECNLKQCYEVYSPKCVISGSIGVVRDLQPAQQSNSIRIYVNETNGKMDSVKIDVIDVRPKPNGYEHQLGVCVQPIFQLADWSQLVRFFEFWLNAGATKFFIYRQSYTREVQSIIDFYQERSNVSIELIDWSDLPLNGTTQNPNLFWYRLEVAISIFDCLSRSRNQVKFIAQTDLDELIILKRKDNNLLKFMEELSEKNPNMSTASFVSRRAKLPPAFDSNISTPADLKFNSFSEILAESYYFPRPAYTKQIHRPERVTRGHIHMLLGSEVIPGTKTNYVSVKVSKLEAYVLHLRRVLGTGFKIYSFRSVDLLSKQSQLWSESFQQRTANFTFPAGQWSDAGVELITDIDKCREKQQKNRQSSCMAVTKCDRQLNSSQWIRVPNSWMLL